MDELMHYGVKGMKWGVRKKYVPHPRQRKSNKTVSRFTAQSVANDIRKRVVRDSSGGPAGNQNCQLCTWATEAQFRGESVLPRAVYSPRDVAFTLNGYDIVKDPVKESIQSKQDVERKVREAGDGSRFYTHVNWEESTGGHEFVVMNVKGKVVVVDSQAGLVSDITTSSGSEYFNHINYSNSFLVRMDNKELNSDILKYNDSKYTTQWDWDADIKYMREHGMLGDDDVSHSIFEDVAMLEILSVFGKSFVFRLFNKPLQSARIIEDFFQTERRSDTVNDEYLMHHGVKGMKWGVRKEYQPKGRKKGKTNAQRIYESVANRRAEKSAEKAALREVQTQRNAKVKPRSVRDMSDDELRSAINRMQMERAYTQLTAKEVNKGKKFVSDVMYNSAKATATKITTEAMTKVIKKLIEQAQRSGSGGDS